MKQITTKLSELGDALEKIYNSDEMDDSEYAPEPIEVDEEETIILDGPVVTITDLGLVAVPGTMYYRDEEGEMEPDWSLTLLYEVGKSPEEYLYYEQDGILTSLHNYMNSIGKGLSEDYECIINV